MSRDALLKATGREPRPPGEVGGGKSRYRADSEIGPGAAQPLVQTGTVASADGRNRSLSQPPARHVGEVHYRKPKPNIFMLLSSAFLLTAGVLALVARKPYLQWRAWRTARR